MGARSDLVRQGTNRPLYCLIRHKVERGLGEGVIKQLQVNSASIPRLSRSEFGRNLLVGRRWEFIYVMKGFILRQCRSLRRSDPLTSFVRVPRGHFRRFGAGLFGVYTHRRFGTKRINRQQAKGRRFLSSRRLRPPKRTRAFLRPGPKRQWEIRSHRE